MIEKKLKYLLSLTAMVLLFFSSAFASDFSLHGFVQGNYSLNTV